MAKPKAKSWHTYATWIARGLMVLLGAGFIGMAVKAGSYMEKGARIETDLATYKVFHEFDKRLAVLEERTKSNASLPPPVLRPTAGRQR